MNPPPGDPSTLWDLLKVYRGFETRDNLSRRMRWNRQRLDQALESLARAGLATLSEESARPGFVGVLQ